jgi:hypothetical protein
MPTTTNTKVRIVVSDHQAMAAAGILATPAVSVDGVPKLSARIPRAEEVESWLQGC